MCLFHDWESGSVLVYSPDGHNEPVKRDGYRICVKCTCIQEYRYDHDGHNYWETINELPTDGQFVFDAEVPFRYAALRLEWTARMRKYRFCPRCGGRLSEEDIIIRANPLSGHVLESIVRKTCPYGGKNHFSVDLPGKQA